MDIVSIKLELTLALIKQGVTDPDHLKVKVDKIYETIVK